MRLGAILAGGRASRFGADKALAEIQGTSLIDHARAALAPHVDRVIVIGRDIPDRPRAGLGPLGGLCAALHQQCDEVLTVPCDVPFPPPALFAALARASVGPPVVCADHPVFGLWPTSVGERLEKWIRTRENHSIRAFAESVGARFVSIDEAIRDIDTQADLAALS